MTAEDKRKEDTEEVETKDLDSFENYFQNSIAQAANTGAFGFGLSSINELTQIKNEGIETNDSLNEKREKVKEMNELPDDDDD